LNAGVSWTTITFALDAAVTGAVTGTGGKDKGCHDHKGKEGEEVFHIE